jgi:hypothetical protein
MIHCKPKHLSFCIRAALGMYTPALAADGGRVLRGKLGDAPYRYRVQFI